MSFGSLVALALGAASVDRPNILFLLVDDMNVWASFLVGHPKVKIPKAARLADVDLTRSREVANFFSQVEPLSLRSLHCHHRSRCPGFFPE